MGKKETQSLNHYDVAEVIDGFGLTKIRNSAVMDAWTQTSESVLTDAEKQWLTEIREDLTNNWDEWNEQELIVEFVAFVMKLAKLNVPGKMRTFYNRAMSGKVQRHGLSVVVDCLVATPRNSGRPKSPYFFLQEFKGSKGDSHDPEGQMPATMVLAQEHNKDQKPLYGAWLQGKIWHFTTLHGKEYTMRRAYDATQEDDLLQVVLMLRRLRFLILGEKT